MARPDATIELADNGGCIVKMYLPVQDDYEHDSPIPSDVYDGEDYSVSKCYVFATLEDGLTFVKLNLPRAISRMDALDKEAAKGVEDAMRVFGTT